MKRKKKKMSDVKAETAVEAPVLVEKGNDNEKGRIEITRGDDGKLHIFLKNPLVAAIIRKMVPGNYTRANVDKIYHAILSPVKDKDGKPDPKAAEMFETRPALAKVTNNFIGKADFSFTDKPSTILNANPDALEAGYTLFYTIDAPVPMDVLKRWGKHVMDGWNDIITNAKPFKMAWVMETVD